MEDNNLQEQEIGEIENSESTDVEQVDENEKDTNDTHKEKVEEKLFTQEDVDKLQAQIDELLQHKPKEKDEVELRLEKVWQREVQSTLKEEGLEIFQDFIRADVDDTDALNIQITKLKEIVGKLELSNSYQPTNHKSVDAYSVAKKNRDAKSMISEKLKF
ncbi:xanthine phosphoribosyltransferase [Heyndrickxia sporothermodurans]|uniref:xanthine phosphoribosyltransferase n=1 Tax=Heyndrickxia sporothermodurans TaxID=46224 RepID=UPI0035DC2C0B